MLERGAEAGLGRVPGFDRPHETVEPLHAVELVRAPHPGLIETATEHGDRLVVGLQRHRKRVAVLAAVREREARRIGEPRRRAVNDLGNERE